LIEKGGLDMAGKVQKPERGGLDSVTARTKLKSEKEKPGRVMQWHDLDVEAAGVSHHLGYQRKTAGGEGRWVLRVYGSDRKYRIEELGKADDVREADGDKILTYKQATAKARLLVGASPKKQSRLTVKEAFEHYVAVKNSQGQPTRDLIYRGNKHILPTLGHKIVANLTSAELRQWLATLASSPALVRSKANGAQRYKPEPTDEEDVRRRRSSANRVLGSLKAALNFAFDEGHVASNLAWGRRVKPFDQVESGRVIYLTVAEAKRLINACDPEFRPLVQAALQTGCRYGELTRLEVQDFNADAGTGAIRKSKTGKARHVILTDEGTAFFRQMTAGRAGNELIFMRANGTAWGKSYQARPMMLACVAAKIRPVISFHGLRHTWASLAVMEGVPLMVVAKNLGHVDTRMVERTYGHLAPSYITDAIRAGAPRFGFKPDKKIAMLAAKGR
jgi:integrase